jgi:hypothetical protein
MHSVAPVTSRNDAFNATRNMLNLLTAAREELAASYAGAPSHSPQENALGEILTFVRKAIEKTTKHGNELGQLELGFDVPREV